MIKRLNRGWRIAATAFCFFVFGLGGLLIRLVIFPLVVLFSPQAEQRQLRARALIRYSFCFFIGLMHKLGIYTYEVIGRERLQRRGLLVVANHPSLIDVVFLISMLEQADCVVRGGLVSNPFTRGPIQAAGFLRNDRGTELLEDCISSVHAGNNLVIFPEGSRTPRNGQLQKFQRGTAHIAIRGQINITPVVIHCRPPMLVKGEKWYRVPVQRPHYRFEIFEDIAVAKLEPNEQGEAIAARHLTQYLYDFFTTETNQHAGA